MGRRRFCCKDMLCDLDLQGSEPNVARDTSSQYDDHIYEIF
jgi:hypothetical protein